MDDQTTMDVDGDQPSEVPKDVDGDQPSEVPKDVYLPTRGHKLKKNEILEHDPSTYLMLHEAHTDAPCMSFDIIPDNLGNNRTYPHTMYTVAGTQACRKKDNSIIIMKWRNLCKTQEIEKDDDDEDSSDESSSSDDENGDGTTNVKSKKTPIMSSSVIGHYGSINRIRSATFGGAVYAAAWSEEKMVNIYNISKHLKAVESSKATQLYSRSSKSKPKSRPREEPLFSYKGFQSDGFAIDWSTTVPGMLATGDCVKNIHIWTPQESRWKVDLRPLKGHEASIEDIQWSPNEDGILASCSVDKSIRVWDIRVAPTKACMLAVEDAHDNDVNVIHWNRISPLIISGGDDQYVKVWDLRNFNKDSVLATFKYHTSGVTSVEWHPTENSVFASSDDTQVALWDLAVERESENDPDELKDVPPQLLFLHLGQEFVKEIHWHKQIPGLLTTTSQNNFQIFQTINV